MLGAIFFRRSLTSLAPTWSDHVMKQFNIRLAFILPPAIIALVASILPFFYEMYNEARIHCMVMPYPSQCLLHTKRGTRFAIQVQVPLRSTCNRYVVPLISITGSTFNNTTSCLLDLFIIFCNHSTEGRLPLQVSCLGVGSTRNLNYVD